MSAHPTPRFDRLCVVFLAIEWIVFGSMHFSLQAETIRQMPQWLPAKPALAVLTGILEVATGIMILVPEVRRWAALSSLVLLVLLLPAVVQILAGGGYNEGWRVAFRTLLLPNNIFMALCSYHLWRHPNVTSAGYAEILDDMLAPRRPPAGTQPPSAALSARWSQTSSQGATLLVAFLLLVANCAGFLTVWVSPITNHPTGYLWSMMCIALGAFVGFLFAVPRFNRDAATSAVLLPNTNIESVSDWLSKIIVGVGLINLKPIGEFIVTTSNDLAQSLGNTTSSFAMALILYFFVDGLIQGYLLTRMFLAWQFALQVGDPAHDEPKPEGGPSSPDRV
jgi:uncharacterized membrane protein YphA (DoxX/SURF4 family)